MGGITAESTFSDALRVLFQYEHLAGHAARQTLRQLDADARTNLFVISVLGEFKRGKSTLINALLGQDLLPRDVTPMTAAICVLRYAPDPVLIVHWSDGTEETKSLEASSLQQFTAAADFDPDTVDYLEVGVNSEILKNGFVLVDTPGVDDLNHHRSEIACRFVPRSDAIIFVLSVASPVRKSEIEFLDTTILEAGLDHILFVANFADTADEDIETMLTQISRRLTPVLGTRQAKVIPLSASVGLQAAMSGDSERQSSSGLAALRQALMELAGEVSRAEVRHRRLLHRALGCTKMFVSDVQQEIALADRDIQSLQNDLATIEAAIASKHERRARINPWLEDRRAEILAMVQKSLRHFQEELAGSVIETVEDYKGTDFKDFIENKVPRYINKACKTWIEQHVGQINTLLNTLDRRLIAALGAEFEAHVPQLRSHGGLVLNSVDMVGLSAEDVSTAPQRAGLLAGGAAAALLVLHASLFVPIIGMAAFPFLVRGMTEFQLRSAKEKIRQPLRDALDQTLTKFEERVLGAVSADIDTLRRTAEDRYDMLMTELRDRVASHIQEKALSQEKTKGKMAELQNALQHLSASAERIAEALSSPVKG